MGRSPRINSTANPTDTPASSDSANNRCGSCTRSSGSTASRASHKACCCDVAGGGSASAACDAGSVFVDIPLNDRDASATSNSKSNSTARSNAPNLHSNPASQCIHIGRGHTANMFSSKVRMLLYIWYTLFISSIQSQTTRVVEFFAQNQDESCLAVA